MACGPGTQHAQARRPPACFRRPLEPETTFQPSSRVGLWVSLHGRCQLVSKSFVVLTVSYRAGRPEPSPPPGVGRVFLQWVYRILQLTHQPHRQGGESSHEGSPLMPHFAHPRVPSCGRASHATRPSACTPAASLQPASLQRGCNAVASRLLPPFEAPPQTCGPAALTCRSAFGSTRRRGGPTSRARGASQQRRSHSLCFR